MPRDIELDLTNSKMYWIDDGTNKIQRADLDDSGVEDLVTGLSAPISIALSHIPIDVVEPTPAPTPDPVCTKLTAKRLAVGAAKRTDSTAALSESCGKSDPDATAEVLAGAAEINPDAISEVIALSAENNPAATAELIAKAAETNPEAMADVLAKAAELNREAIAELFTEASPEIEDALAGILAGAAALNPTGVSEVMVAGAAKDPETIKRILTEAARLNPESIAALPDIAAIRDGSPISSKAIAVVTGLAPLGAGKAYEGWFVSDDGARKQSTGILELDVWGNGVATYVSESGENVLGSFNTFVITVEPVPDPDPAPSSEVASVHTIPVGGITHIRHLLVSWPPNPSYTSGTQEGTPKGIVVGLREQAQVALLHAGLSLRSGEAGDLVGTKAHAEHVINIITGGEGTDVDGNGQVENPGDRGPGLVAYAQDAADHARLAMKDAPGDQTITRHAPRVAGNADEVKTLVGMALEQAALAMRAGDIVVARLYMTNVESLLRAAVAKAEATYVAAQDMGTFMPMPPLAPEAPPEAPKVGDYNLSTIALMTLIAGLLLSLSGIYLYRRGRSRRQEGAR